jgi:phosphoadenosine phosphosulfate reductase
VSVTAPTFSDEELEQISADLEVRSAGAAVRWAVDTFGADRLLLTASFQDAVLIDIATKVDPAIEVIFIDTGYHFPETLESVEAVRRRYDLNLRVMHVPEADPPLWQVDPEGCCSAAKVMQLNLALVGKSAWMSGLRRAEASTRADAPIVGRDSRGLVKVNPLATWNDDDVAGYIRDHDIPTHPLLSQGYASIGCAPCTRPVAPGDDPRSGRWFGSEKTECGLHE